MKPCRNQKYITGNPGGSRWSADPPERSTDLAEITEVRIDEIYPHPDNPRTDLGDITELTESIKKNGIMQNLTVIPGHYLTDDEWRDLSNRWKAHPDESIRAAMNSKWVDEGYTSLIGHRRLAAAKEAGLETVPCRILADTDKKQQIMIMLEENMQRNDLTVMEQAQTFQQLTLWGETEASLAEKTGFSRTTVRHRLQIARLDKDILEQKEKDNFQLSLTDLYELERIHNIEKRNEILRNAKDAGEIRWRVDVEVKNIARMANKGTLIAMLEAMGIKPVPQNERNTFRWYGEWEHLKTFDLMEDPPEEWHFKADEIKKLRYYADESEIIVGKKKEGKKREKSPEEILREQQVAKTNQLKEIQKKMVEDRAAFLERVYAGEYKPDLKKVPLIEEGLWNCMVDFGGPVYDYYLREAFFNDYGQQPSQEIRMKIRQKPMDLQMLVFVQNMSKGRNVVGWNGEYNKDVALTLRQFYAILTMYGYALTDPEHIALLNGTSELYWQKGKK